MPRCAPSDSCPDARATWAVGVSSAKSWKRLPLIGSSLNVFSATRLLAAGSIASSRDAVTSVVVRMASKASSRSTRTAAPTPTTTPSVTLIANSSLEAATVYSPGFKETA